MFTIFKKQKIDNTDSNTQDNSQDNSSKSFFKRALSKTISHIKEIVPQKKEKIEFDVIEEILIESDIEYEVIEKIMDGLPPLIKRSELRHRLIHMFEYAPKINNENRPKPFVELIIGINGAGKTTTIA